MLNSQPQNTSTSLPQTAQIPETAPIYNDSYYQENSFQQLPQTETELHTPENSAAQVPLFSTVPSSTPPLKNPKPKTKNTKAKSLKSVHRNIRRKSYQSNVRITTARLLPITGPNRHQRYKVQIQYTTSDRENSTKNLTVQFGDRRRQYFIDHKNKDKTRIDVTRLRREDLLNPFHPRFWEFKLLNNIEYSTIEDAWKAYISSLTPQL